MKYIQRPAFAARATVEACIASIQAGPLKDRLNLVVGNIEAAETDYLLRGPVSALYEIAEANNVGGQVTGPEMERVYKNTFVRSARTRHIYDAIKKLPANDICPLCSQRTVSTLDHYLAKTRHPALAVTPANLVPACADCNKLKLDAQPGTAEQQTLHPYFDQVDDAVWLVAEVQETTPAGLSFAADPPAIWGALKAARVQRHFETFGLGQLYAAHAGVELANIRYSLGLLSDAGGGAAVQRFVEEQAESSREVHRNSWRAAAYEAWGNSEWFCEGGFALT